MAVLAAAGVLCALNAVLLLAALARFKRTRLILNYISSFKITRRRK